MRLAGFATDASLAAALTALLREQGRLKKDREIPEQTIQSARKRIKNDGLSKYTLDIAKLCRVDPYWLAFGMGEPRGLPSERSNIEDRELDFVVAAWPRLSEAQRNRIAGIAEGAVDSRPSAPFHKSTDVAHESTVPHYVRRVRSRP